MTRPHVIRADTIDLQDPGAPSAKDHSRQPTRPNPIGEGAPAPHQAEALKHVEMEISEQHGRSPRASADLSGKELQLLPHDSDANYHQDPTENLLRNAGQQAVQDDADDVDGDDGLDDDMGDKVSSSPSIGDDGGYSVPSLPRPLENRSVSTPLKKATHSPGPPIDDFSSSPFEETPTHFPLSSPRTYQRSPLSEGHHQKGEFDNNRLSGILVDEFDMGKRERRSISSSESGLSEQEQDYTSARESLDEVLDLTDFHHLLLPENDPLLDNSFDDTSLEPDSSTSSSSSPASQSSWNPEDPDNQYDDDSEDFSYDPDSRFVDSGWGGECLREIEDIDFEFVYALHTFVATVEGQANATKGDTMVLLDDSNSYWWLVRIVKDSSIGYLPAEHIETPLERLARLNKHRNLDLSQTMLGDQDEDKRQNPLNPLRKAMRRRNVKKVDFAAANSYLEPDDTQFSSSEDEDDSEINGQDRGDADEQRAEQQNEVDQDATVAPLNTRERTVNGKRNDEARNEPDARNGVEHANGNDQLRTSDEDLDEDGTSSRSRKGTVRNTDSFFKDESVETRKINLTPSLLRDDSNAPPQQNFEPESRLAGNSLDSLEKDPPLDKPKEEKKKKEKRGMLGGMFKRKDKKSKDRDPKEIAEEEKISGELSRKSPTPKESMESLSSNNQPSPHRQTSKLQKQRPANLSPKGSHRGDSRPVSAGQPSAPTTDLDRKISSAGSDGSMRLVLPESQPLFDKMPTPLQSKEHSPQDAAPAERLDQKEPPQDRNVNAFNSAANAPRPIPADMKPEPLKTTPQRIRMNDFDESSTSSAEQPIQRTTSHESQDRIPRSVSHEPQEPLQRIKSRESQEQLQRKASQERLQRIASQERMQRTTSREAQERLQHQESQEKLQRTISHESAERQRSQSSQQDHHLALAQAAQHEPHPAPSRERLSESPVEVSPPIGPERNTLHQPPPLVTDMSSPSDSSPSPISPPSSPELIEPPSSTSAQSQPQSENAREVVTPHKPIPAPVNTMQDSPASTSASTSRSLPAWSDASLRAYMEDDSEIRDLLIIVHDKSGVVPRKDHPVVKDLFKEENRQLNDIERRLDGLLGDFLARRGRSLR